MAKERGGEKDREKEGKEKGGGWRTTLRTPCRKFLATPLVCLLCAKLSQWTCDVG